jgi:hypothetical protein
LRDAGDVSEQGWLSLTRAERSDRPAEMVEHALEAVETARRFDDRDLEAAALVRLGYAEVATGDVVSGMEKVDEALTAATGGEVASLEVIGDVICVGIGARELAADWQRIEQWGQAVEGWITSLDHVAVLGFCYACCAEMFIASGNWEMADGMLAEGLQAMQAANLRARCVHPAAKLAELRITQGRIEEAEQLLAGFEELPESTHALALLYLARGETAMAAAVLPRRLNAVGDENVLAAPFLDLSVDVRLAQGDREGAEATTTKLEAVAAASSLPRLEAMAGFARGRRNGRLQRPSGSRNPERGRLRVRRSAAPAGRGPCPVRALSDARGRATGGRSRRGQGGARRVRAPRRPAGRGRRGGLPAGPRRGGQDRTEGVGVRNSDHPCDLRLRPSWPPADPTRSSGPASDSRSPERASPRARGSHGSARERVRRPVPLMRRRQRRRAPPPTGGSSPRVREGPRRARRSTDHHRRDCPRG